MMQAIGHNFLLERKCKEVLRAFIVNFGNLPARTIFHQQLLEFYYHFNDNFAHAFSLFQESIMSPLAFPSVVISIY